MEKYKNSVADIELPNVRKWNSVLVLKDDQEVLLDTVMSGTGTGMKQSRPSSLKISQPSDEDPEQNSQGLSCQDIRQICPTCIILLITIVIMVTVIPYAFSNVIKQMQAADAVAAWREKMEENKTSE